MTMSNITIFYEILTASKTWRLCAFCSYDQPGVVRPLDYFHSNLESCLGQMVGVLDMNLYDEEDNRAEILARMNAFELELQELKGKIEGLGVVLTILTDCAIKDHERQAMREKKKKRTGYKTHPKRK